MNKQNLNLTITLILILGATAFAHLFELLLPEDVAFVAFSIVFVFLGLLKNYLNNHIAMIAALVVFLSTSMTLYFLNSKSALLGMMTQMLKLPHPIFIPLFTGIVYAILTFLSIKLGTTIKRQPTE